MPTYAIISDLHLISEIDLEVKAKIQYLLENSIFLVINGDLSERQEKNWKKWKKNWGWILEHSKIILLQGNHDYEALTKYTSREFFIESRKKRFIVFHGKVFDSSNQKIKRIETKINNLGWRVIPCIWRLFTKIMNYRQKRHFLPSNVFHIFGHTHCAELDLKNKYCNTGQFGNGIYDVTYIEGGKIWQKQL